MAERQCGEFFAPPDEETIPCSEFLCSQFDRLRKGHIDVAFSASDTDLLSWRRLRRSGKVVVKAGTLDNKEEFRTEV